VRHRPFTILRVGLGSLFALLGACASRLPATAPAAPGADPLFPAAPGILSGFDEFRAGQKWEPGDTVLLGIAADGRGLSRRWYLKAVALEQPRVTSGAGGERLPMVESAEFTYLDQHGVKQRMMAVFGLVPVQVDLFDERGARVSRTIAMQPEDCMRYGFTDMIELGRQGKHLYDDLPRVQEGQLQLAGEPQIRLLAGWLALSRMPGFLQRKEMGGVFSKLIERPSLLSLALGKRSISISMPPHEPTPEQHPPVAVPGPVYRMPLLVDVSGTLAMRCELIVAPPTPPLGPCNGLLGIDAVNPRDPSKRVTIRLLAARHVEIPNATGPAAPPSTPRHEQARVPRAPASPGGTAPSPAGSAR
jgi:hypothetical protein